MSKMMILRGNSGPNTDESGHTQGYAKGALHERPAMEYASRRGYDGFVLDVSGDRAKPVNGKKVGRDKSPQTIQAVDKFLRDPEIEAIYGFSGGGFNVYWILHALQEKDLKRLKLVVVLGAPDTPKSEYEASKYPGGSWELVYLTNPPKGSPLVPKNVGETHMFGPDWLLAQTPDPGAQTTSP